VDEQSLGVMLASSMLALAVMREGQITFSNPAFDALFRSPDTLADADLASLVNSSAAEALTDALIPSPRDADSLKGFPDAGVI